MNALSPSLLTDTVLSSTSNPDAELIRVCAEHAINIVAVNSAANELDDGPAAEAYGRTADYINEATPMTTAGWRALAGIARVEMNSHSDGVTRLEGTPALFWAEKLIDFLAAEPGEVKPNPDADLITDCNAFDELERDYSATGFGHILGSPEEAAAEAEQDRIHDAQGDLLRRIYAVRAVTIAGQVARARSAITYNERLVQEGRGGKDHDEVLIHAILRDLVSEGDRA